MRSPTRGWPLYRRSPENGGGLCAANINSINGNGAPEILEEMAEHLFNLFDANCMDE